MASYLLKYKENGQTIMHPFTAYSPAFAVETARDHLRDRGADVDDRLPLLVRADEDGELVPIAGPIWLTTERPLPAWLDSP